MLEHGFTPFPGDTDYASYGILIENPNPDTHLPIFTTVSITAKDVEGVVVATQSETILAIPPGQTTAVAGLIFDAGAATTLEILVNPSRWQTIDYQAGTWEYRNVRTVRQDYGGWRTTGELVSGFQTTREGVPVSVIYRNAAGAIVGGDTTYVDVVPVGGAIGFEVSSIADFPDVAATEVYAGTGRQQD